MRLQVCRMVYEDAAGIGPERIAFLPPGNRDFRDVCRIFSFSIEGLESHLQRFGLAVDTCLSHLHDGYVPWDKVRFYELLEDQDFQAEVKRQVADAGKALQRYLAAVGFFDHRQDQGNGAGARQAAPGHRHEDAVRAAALSPRLISAATIWIARRESRSRH